jgi:M6 family metalloprotease-like protein
MFTRHHDLRPSSPRPAGRPGLVAAVLAVLAATVLPAGSGHGMPPPGPGNTRGLPESVRRKLVADPDLFYPRKGFRNVIERQKESRREIRAELLRNGLAPSAADMEVNSRITVTRFCPVLCGLYTDKPSPDWPVADLVDQLFSLDYGQTNTLGQPGSMREHYRDMSYGTFDLQGGVFGWFPVPEARAYYASDDNGLGTDRAVGETGAFIRHTLQSSDGTVDFRTYDNDGPDNIPDSGDDDGYVDLVMFVHPNSGGECGDDDIWSHSFVYSGWAQHNSQPFFTNDIGHDGQPIKVDDYVIMPAISCTSGGRIEIGVFSHEFGHALGLPDLYDRTAVDPAGAVTSGGMGLYCLMAAGSYGGDFGHPEVPTQMCAWSKESLGWLQPHEIICDESRSLYYLGDAPDAAKLWTGGDYATGEWFLVENRQKKDWDRYLSGDGFLITHIDNNVTTQNDEPCPTGNPCLAGHYQVMVVEADNTWEMQGPNPNIAGPWFGEPTDFFNAANNATWNDLTLPSSRNHTGGLTGVSVENIGPSGLKMMADFSVGLTCSPTPSLAVVNTRITGGCDLVGFLDPGETVSLGVTIRNQPTAAAATAITGTLTSLTPGVSVVDGSVGFPSLSGGKFGTTIVPFRVLASGAVACTTTATLRLSLAAAGGYAVSQDFTVPLATDSLFVPINPFEDTIEGPTDNGWHHRADVNSDDWTRSTNGNHTLGAVPGHSWFSAAPATGKDVSLLPPAIIPSATTVLSFWHRYDTEDDWDGCLLELSTDAGDTWIDVGDLTDVGYDDAVMVNPQSTISGRRCWNGLSDQFPLFQQVTLNLGPYAGLPCQLRFRLATDLSTTGTTPLTGWNIDDFNVTNAQILRQVCEATPLCTDQETAAPLFAGLDSATNPNTSSCDAVDLKWSAATDASPPVSYLVYASTTSPVPLTTPVASTTALKYRVTGLAPGATWRFVVRARDAQGNVDANTVERSVTLSCDLPVLDIASTALTPVDECDDDGRPDNTETFALSVILRNTSFSNASGVSAVLRDDSGNFTVPVANAAFGAIEARHDGAADHPFEFIVTGNTLCQATGRLALDITAAGGYAVTRTVELLLESDESLVDVDYVTDVESPPAAPLTHSAEDGADAWAIVTSDAFSPTHSWFHPDAGSVTNSALVSPPLYVSANSVLSFRHRFVLEEGYDGAVLEVSTDGGNAWTDIGASYNSMQEPLGPVFGSPFQPGKAYWSGDSGGWLLESINLGSMTSALGEPHYAGRTVLVRWRIGCDDTNTSAPFVGWWIDDIVLTNTRVSTLSCDATPSCAISGAPESPKPPVATVLNQNRPNPVRGSTSISFVVAPGDAGPVRLNVYDVTGRRIRGLLDGPRDAGAFESAWDGTDDAGRRVPPGIYFYELVAGGHRQVRKLMIAD